MYPIKTNKNNDDKTTTNLKTLRNNSTFIVLMLNTLWIGLIFIIQLLTGKLKDKIFIEFAIGKENPIKYEPISFIYVMLFLLVLLIQFCAMIWHRCLTIMQIIRKTSLNGIGKKPRRFFRNTIKYCKRKKIGNQNVQPL